MDAKGIPRVWVKPIGKFQGVMHYSIYTRPHPRLPPSAYKGPYLYIPQVLLVYTLKYSPWVKYYHQKYLWFPWVCSRVLPLAYLLHIPESILYIYISISCRISLLGYAHADRYIPLEIYIFLCTPVYFPHVRCFLGFLLLPLLSECRA